MRGALGAGGAIAPHADLESAGTRLGYGCTEADTLKAISLYSILAVLCAAVVTTACDDGRPAGADSGASGSGGSAGGSGAGTGGSSAGTGGGRAGTGGAGTGGGGAGTGGAGGRVAGTGGSGAGGRAAGTGGSGTGGSSAGTGGAGMGTGGAGTGGTGGAGGRAAGTGGAGGSVCSLPFEAGSCLALFPVFAFVEGACVERIYGGCGGNANRFESLEACLAACEARPPNACPAGRTRARICLACGPAGGCGETAEVCAQSCDATRPCAGRLLMCADGVCQAGGCI